MRAFHAAAASAFLLAIAVPAIAKPAVQPTVVKPSSQPDLLLLVYAAENGDGQVALTYPGVVSKSQVSRDITALQTATGWSVKGVSVTEELAPVQGSSQKMTSAVFTAPGVVSSTSQYFTIEPIIDALRSYPQVAITYFVSPKFQFHGLRGYESNDVSISLDHHGSTYSYRVMIRDPRYRKLNLPLYQANEASVRSAAHDTGRRPIHFWQVALLAAVAAIAGGLVYLATAGRNA